MQRIIYIGLMMAVLSVPAMANSLFLKRTNEAATESLKVIAYTRGECPFSLAELERALGSELLRARISQPNLYRDLFAKADVLCLKDYTTSRRDMGYSVSFSFRYCARGDFKHYDRMSLPVCLTDMDLRKDDLRGYSSTNARNKILSDVKTLFAEFLTPFLEAIMELRGPQ